MLALSEFIISSLIANGSPRSIQMYISDSGRLIYSTLYCIQKNQVFPIFLETTTVSRNAKNCFQKHVKSVSKTQFFYFFLFPKFWKIKILCFQNALFYFFSVSKILENPNIVFPKYNFFIFYCIQFFWKIQILCFQNLIFLYLSESKILEDPNIVFPKVNFFYFQNLGISKYCVSKTKNFYFLCFHNFVKSKYCISKTKNFYFFSFQNFGKSKYYVSKTVFSIYNILENPNVMFPIISKYCFQNLRIDIFYVYKFFGNLRLRIFIFGIKFFKIGNIVFPKFKN